MFDFLPHIPKKQQGPTRRLFNWIGNSFRGVVDLRDWLLVVAGAFYFFGYIVWSINAKRNNLGLLSALDFQYFIAGIFPVITLVAIFFVTISVGALRRRIITSLSSEATGWRKLARNLVFGFLAISLLLIAVTPRSYSHSRYLVTYAFMICCLIAPEFSELPVGLSQKIKYFANNGFESILRLETFIGRQFARLLLIAFPVLGFFWFITSVYPKLPQEFGGMRPSCAYLDIEKARLSKETVSEIVSTDQSKTIDPILRSVQVEVLFSGSDVIVIRLEGKVYKVTKSAIQAVRTCK